METGRANKRKARAIPAGSAPTPATPAPATQAPASQAKTGQSETGQSETGQCKAGKAKATPDKAPSRTTQPKAAGGKATRVKTTRAKTTRAKTTRAERSEQTRAALILAAGEIVGELGYLEASVARITMRAGVAQGTFYNYFTSRQELFDQLLPRLGLDMLEFIRENVDKEADGVERERQRFQAYLRYLDETPGFYRVLYEAETLAPKAHRTHIENVVTAYKRSLKRGWERGEMPAYDEDEIEAVAYMLIAIRDYYSLRYGRETRDESGARKAVETYTKVIRGGIFSDRRD